MKDLKRFAFRNTQVAMFELTRQRGTHLSPSGLLELKMKVDKLMSARVLQEGVHRDVWVESEIAGHAIKLTFHRDDEAVETEIRLGAT